MFVVVLIIFLVIFSIIILFLKTNKKALPSPNLQFDGVMVPFKPKITLTRNHLGMPLVLPRIESYQVNKRKKGRRSLTLTLPELLKPSDIIRIKAPTHSINKSCTVKVKGFQILINGHFKEEVYLWQTRDGGDVTFKYEENEWGYYYWKAEGDKNLREDPTQNPTAKNVQEGMKQCVGATAEAAEGYEEEDLSAIGSSIPDAYACMRTMGCILGIGKCEEKTQDDPPLTNKDIINDMTIVLQKEVQVEAAAELFTTWSQFSGGTLSDQTANSSWYNYVNTLTNNIQANQNLLLEYGKGGDPELVFSNSIYDSENIRKFLVSGNTETYGKDACDLQPGFLCNMINIYEYVLDAFLASDYSAAFGPGWTSLDNISLFPFYTQVMQSYLTTLREMALRSPMQNESGKFFAPWLLIANQTNYQETVSARLPLAYKFYNQYVNQYLEGVVWETNTFDCSAGVRPTYAINYCAYNPNFSQDAEGDITCFVQNGQNIQNTKVDIDSDGTKTPYVGVNHASLVDNNYNKSTYEQLLTEWDQNGFSSSAANYPQGGFPGWAPTVNRFISPFSGDPNGWFCLTDDMLTAQRDQILQAVKLSITELLHDHNGRPFDLYDSMAQSAGLTCSQSADANGTATGNWSCAPTNLTYTENGENFIVGAFFGNNNGVPSTSMTDAGINLQASEQIPILQDYSFKYANGYAFDATAFSSTGYFTTDTILCCPSNTTFVVGGSRLSISESLGSEQFPDIRRELNCGAFYDVGNQVVLPGYSQKAEKCRSTATVALQEAGPIVVGIDYDIAGATGFKGAPFDLMEENGPFYDFVNFGLPLQMNTLEEGGYAMLSLFVFYLPVVNNFPNPPTPVGWLYSPESFALIKEMNLQLNDGDLFRIELECFTASGDFSQSSYFTYTSFPASMTTTSTNSVYISSSLQALVFIPTSEDMFGFANKTYIIEDTNPELRGGSNIPFGTQTQPGTCYTAFFVPLAVSYSTISADAIPKIVNGTCTAKVPVDYSAVTSADYGYVPEFYSFTSIDVPQMFVYNFSFTAAQNSALPAVVTVSDNTLTVLVTNTGLQDNYNFQFGDIYTTTENQFGNFIVGLQSGQCSSSCSTGLSFEIISADIGVNNVASLDQGSPYIIRVFEFIEPWKDASLNPTTCQNEPFGLCNTCSFESTFSNFNWAGYKKGPSTASTPPNWKAFFIY